MRECIKGHRIRRLRTTGVSDKVRTSDFMSPPCTLEPILVFFGEHVSCKFLIYNNSSGLH